MNTAGNVGVGTITPDSLFTVNGSSNLKGFITGFTSMQVVPLAGAGGNTRFGFEALQNIQSEVWRIQP